MSFHKKMSNFISRLIKHEDGVTAIEYALIAAAIIVAIYLLVNAIGGSTSGTFSTINSALAR
jgi:Flp pilus assembly pilin Flp